MMKKKKNSKEFNKRFKKRFLTRKALSVMFFTTIILTIIFVSCFGTLRQERQLQSVINEYTAENKKLRDQNEAIEEEKQKVQDMNEAMLRGDRNSQCDESIKDIARNVLGMIDADDYSLQELSEDEDQKTD